VCQGSKSPPKYAIYGDYAAYAEKADYVNYVGILPAKNGGQNMDGFRMDFTAKPDEKNGLFREKMGLRACLWKEMHENRRVV